MTHFLLRHYNILPKKELHWSPWVDTEVCEAIGPPSGDSRFLDHASADWPGPSNGVPMWLCDVFGVRMEVHGGFQKQGPFFGVSPRNRNQNILESFPM